MFPKPNKAFICLFEHEDTKKSLYIRKKTQQQQQNRTYKNNVCEQNIY